MKRRRSSRSSVAAATTSTRSKKTKTLALNSKRRLKSSANDSTVDELTENATKTNDAAAASTSSTVLNDQSEREEAQEKPSSPEPNCSICLSKMEDKSFTQSCYHMFCFTCLVEWSKVKAVCPLCKQTFKSIIHNVRSETDYDVYDIKENNVPPLNPSIEAGSGFDMLGDLSRLMSGFFSPIVFQPTDHSMALRFPRMPLTSGVTAAVLQGSEIRRRVYQTGRIALGIQLPAGMQYRIISPAFFAGNLNIERNLVTWLNRELSILLQGDDHHDFVLQLIMNLVEHFDILSEDFYQQLLPFIGERTRHFIHEFHTFARSPLEITDTDRLTLYDDGATTSGVVEVITLDKDDSDVEIVSPPVVTSNNTNGTFGNRLRRLFNDFYLRSPDVFFVPSMISLNVNSHASEMNGTSTSSGSPIAGPSRQQESAGTPQFLMDEEHLIQEVSDSDSSRMSVYDNEIMFVGFDKPPRSRTPISLSSDGSDVVVDDVVLGGSLSRKNKLTLPRKRRRNRSKSSSESGRFSDSQHSGSQHQREKKPRHRCSVLSSSNCSSDQNEKENQCKHTEKYSYKRDKVNVNDKQMDDDEEKHKDANVKAIHHKRRRYCMNTEVIDIDDVRHTSEDCPLKLSFKKHNRGHKRSSDRKEGNYWCNGLMAPQSKTEGANSLSTNDDSTINSSLPSDGSTASSYPPSDGATTSSDGTATSSDGATTSSDGATASSDGATTSSDYATTSFEVATFLLDGAAISENNERSATLLSPSKNSTCEEPLLHDCAAASLSPSDDLAVFSVPSAAGAEIPSQSPADFSSFLPPALISSGLDENVRRRQKLRGIDSDESLKDGVGETLKMEEQEEEEEEEEEVKEREICKNGMENKEKCFQSESEFSSDSSDDDELFHDSSLTIEYESDEMTKYSMITSVTSSPVNSPVQSQLNSPEQSQNTSSFVSHDCIDVDSDSVEWLDSKESESNVVVVDVPSERYCSTDFKFYNVLPNHPSNVIHSDDTVLQVSDDDDEIEAEEDKSKVSLFNGAKKIKLSDTSEELKTSDQIMALSSSSSRYILLSGDDNEDDLVECLHSNVNHSMKSRHTSSVSEDHNVDTKCDGKEELETSSAPATATHPVCAFNSVSDHLSAGSELDTTNTSSSFKMSGVGDQMYEMETNTLERKEEVVIQSNISDATSSSEANVSMQNIQNDEILINRSVIISSHLETLLTNDNST